MNVRAVLTALLVVGTLPVAAANVAPAAASASPAEQGQTPQVQTTTAAASSGGSTAASSSGSATAGGRSGTPAGNYTRLFVETKHGSPEVKPGETTTFYVTVANAEDESVTLDPHVFVPPVGDERRIRDAWVSVGDESPTVDPGEEVNVSVTVTVPDDAELGYYRGEIAFTDETVAYPGRPARPVHAAHLNLEVWRKPTVEVVSGEYMHAQIEAGETYSHDIVVENTGDQAVPVNPSVNTGNRVRHYPGDTETIDRSWISFDAPTEIPAGETRTVTVTVSPPADADRNDYDVEVDLGLKDPARPDDDRYWQQVHLGFQVWTQPQEPYTTTFDVTEGTQSMALKLRTGTPGPAGAGGEDARFDVAFVTPDGETVAVQPTRVSDSGFVDLSAQRQRRMSTDGAYATRSGGQRFRYEVADPQAGEWTLRVMPHNAVSFRYDVVRNQTAAGT